MLLNNGGKVLRLTRRGMTGIYKGSSDESHFDYIQSCRLGDPDFWMVTFHYSRSPG